MRDYTLAKLAYAEDLRRRPTYHDGTPRRAWDTLDPAVQDTWRRNPTPREYPAQNPD